MTDVTQSAEQLVSIILQKSGEVPMRKGPYAHEQVEAVVRELYKHYPDAVVIVMPGLPESCWPEHGQAYLDMMDAERCICVVDEERDPKCPVDHSRRDIKPPPATPTREDLLRFVEGIACYDRYHHDDEDQIAILANIELDAQKLWNGGEQRPAVETAATLLCDCSEFCAVGLCGQPGNGGRCRRSVRGLETRAAESEGEQHG